LMILEEERLRREHGVTNVAGDKRRAKRLAEAVETAAKAGRVLPKMQLACQRATQRSVKFIRWLRRFLFGEADWDHMVAVLTQLLATP
jgi:ribulose-5-phosphate 4-epimerase/fuculose-1-phosphate aldolase